MNRKMKSMFIGKRANQRRVISEKLNGTHINNKLRLYRPRRLDVIYILNK